MMVMIEHMDREEFSSAKHYISLKALDDYLYYWVHSTQPVLSCGRSGFLCYCVAWLALLSWVATPLVLAWNDCVRLWREHGHRWNWPLGCSQKTRVARWWCLSVAVVEGLTRRWKERTMHGGGCGGSTWRNTQCVKECLRQKACKALRPHRRTRSSST